MYSAREFVLIGGLMAYSAPLTATDDSGNLPAPVSGKIERSRHLSHLARPADELCKTAGRVCLEARAH